jgi:protein gp37
MGRTSIEWTDQSWPVVNGCRRISEGCTNCYAERLTATRLSQTPKYKGLAVFGKNGPRWTGEARLWAPHLDMPLRLKKPSRIFVADMGDLFYEGVPDWVIAAVFGVMAALPRHTFQVLTKRPERARGWLRSLEGYDPGDALAEHAAAVLERFEEPEAAGKLRAAHRFGAPFPRGWPLPNVWIGVSVEDQATADERIPILVDTPAAVRFVSAEPLLGPVDLRLFLPKLRVVTLDPSPEERRLMTDTITGKDMTPEGFPCTGVLTVAGLDWVIVGGESGPGARPFDLAWARELVRQCRWAGTACFVKQLGARPVEDYNPGEAFDCGVALRDRKGGDMAEWPEDLRVRQFPTGMASVLPEKGEEAGGGPAETSELPGG